MTKCIEWAGKKDRRGYGRLHRRGGGRNQAMLAHRYTWEMAHGPIPAGLHVLHSCHNPSCVNVAHLRLGTHQDNMRDEADRGTQKGQNNPGSKLTEEQAVYAMARLLIGETQKSVASAFDVSRPAINMLWNGKRWAHLFATQG